MGTLRRAAGLTIATAAVAALAACSVPAANTDPQNEGSVKFEIAAEKIHGVVDADWHDAVPSILVDPAASENSWLATALAVRTVAKRQKSSGDIFDIGVVEPGDSEPGNYFRVHDGNFSATFLAWADLVRSRQFREVQFGGENGTQLTGWIGSGPAPTSDEAQQVLNAAGAKHGVSTRNMPALEYSAEPVRVHGGGYTPSLHDTSTESPDYARGASLQKKLDALRGVQEAHVSPGIYTYVSVRLTDKTAALRSAAAERVAETWSKSTLGTSVLSLILKVGTSTFAWDGWDASKSKRYLADAAISQYFIAHHFAVHATNDGNWVTADDANISLGADIRRIAAGTSLSSAQAELAAQVTASGLEPEPVAELVGVTTKTRLLHGTVNSSSDIANARLGALGDPGTAELTNTLQQTKLFSSSAVIVGAKRGNIYEYVVYVVPRAVNGQYTTITAEQISNISNILGSNGTAESMASGANSFRFAGLWVQTADGAHLVK